MRRNSCRESLRTGAAICALGLLFAGCAPLSISQEQQMGDRLAGKIRSESTLVSDEFVADYVRDIGERILAAAGPHPFRYSFHVIEETDINAFAGPAGYIYVNTGTVMAADNVSELAGVIAHEIGHVFEHHVSDRIAQQRSAGVVYQTLATVAGVFGGRGAYELTRLGGGVAVVGILNSFSREAEEEADAFAARVLPRAGYDPNGLVTFFEKLAKADGHSLPAFASDHPATADRIATTRALIASVPPTPGLQVSDRGRLEYAQHRIGMSTGAGVR
jgi:predicted Zn-dependent protease